MLLRLLGAERGRCVVARPALLALLWSPAAARAALLQRGARMRHERAQQRARRRSCVAEGAPCRAGLRPQREFQCPITGDLLPIGQRPWRRSAGDQKCHPTQARRCKSVQN